MDAQVELMKMLISHHFDSLKGFSRSVEEWIIDNIVQPLDNREMLSLPDAIRTLDNNFYFYQSSPAFQRNWEWYCNLPISNAC